jgi:hypothetical protein
MFVKRRGRRGRGIRIPGTKFADMDTGDGQSTHDSISIRSRSLHAAWLALDTTRKIQPKSSKGERNNMDE